MGLIDDIRNSGYVDDQREPLVVPGYRLTLADVADHVRSGADVLDETRDFLDGAGRADDATLSRLTMERPRPVDGRTDALVAALAEHVMAVRNLEPPAWAGEAGRFLDRFWFVSDVPGLRATALVQTPVALKRRGIYWPARSLERV